MCKEGIISGIYGIEDAETGKIYVGSANSKNGIKKRWSNHSTRLKNGTYSYVELQEAYNQNKDRIKWTILEECSDELLEERENYWINYCDSIDGWTVINKEKKATRKRDVRDITNMCKAQTGEKNGHNTKLSVQDVKEIKMLLQKGVRQKELAKQYCVSDTLIHNILVGKRWASVDIEDINVENVKEAECTGIQSTSLKNII